MSPESRRGARVWGYGCTIAERPTSVEIGRLRSTLRGRALIAPCLERSPSGRLEGDDQRFASTSIFDATLSGVGPKPGWGM